LYGLGKCLIVAVQRNVEWKFGGLISYDVISWDCLCVFMDGEVGTGLISVTLRHKRAIKLLCPLTSFIMLKWDP